MKILVGVALGLLSSATALAQPAITPRSFSGQAKGTVRTVGDRVEIVGTDVVVEVQGSAKEAIKKLAGTGKEIVAHGTVVITDRRTLPLKAVISAKFYEYALTPAESAKLLEQFTTQDPNAKNGADPQRNDATLADKKDTAATQPAGNGAGTAR